jgi:hypothetical protein
VQPAGGKAIGLTSPRGDVVATVAMCPEETIAHVSVAIQDVASVEPPSVWELDAHGAGSTVVRLGELPPGWTEVVPIEEVPPGRSIVVRVVTSDRTYVNVADPDALADDRLEVMDVYVTPDRFDANRAEECRRFHGSGPWSRPTTWVLAGLFDVMVLALGIGLTWWASREVRRDLVPPLPPRPDRRVPKPVWRSRT